MVRRHRAMVSLAFAAAAMFTSGGAQAGELGALVAVSQYSGDMVSDAARAEAERQAELLREQASRSGGQDAGPAPQDPAQTGEEYEMRMLDSGWAVNCSACLP